MRLSLADRINDYLHQHDNITVHIGSDGDPFASLVYRHFMRTVPVGNNLKFNLQTNGLLMKKMLQRTDRILSRIGTINISIDGATKDTYEKLRRGGQWEKLLENLEFIKQYHQQFTIKFHMVVQRDNWQEMNQMLELADQYQAHEVQFNKINNWNTYENFDLYRAPEQNEQFRQELNKVEQHPKANTWNYKLK